MATITDEAKRVAMLRIASDVGASTGNAKMEIYDSNDNLIDTVTGFTLTPPSTENLFIQLSIIPPAFTVAVATPEAPVVLTAVRLLKADNTPFIKVPLSGVAADRTFEEPGEYTVNTFKIDMEE